MPRVTLPDFNERSLANAAFEVYAPEIGAAGAAFSLAVYQHSKLSLREMEAARYRTAQINGCQVCQRFRGGRDLAGHVERSGGDAGRSAAARGPAPDEAFYENIQSWRNSALYSDRERLATEYAERLGERPHSMEGDEGFWSRMHAHFSDAEIVDMSLSIASWMALGRVVHALELDTVCMPTFDLESA